MKEVCSLLTGIPVEDFEKEEVKSSYLGEEWNKWYVLYSKNVGSSLVSKFEPEIKYYFSSKKECKDFCDKNRYTGVQSNKLLISHTLEKITVRQMLQYIGTDLFRDKFHPNTWVNALMKDYKPVPNPKNRDYLSINGEMVDVGMSYDRKEYPNWIITDVRFPNETQAIKDRGGIVIRVDRPIKVEGMYEKDKAGFDVLNYTVNRPISMHESETALDDYKFDYTIENDSDIPSLVEKVKEMLIHFKLM